MEEPYAVALGDQAVFPWHTTQRGTGTGKRVGRSVILGLQVFRWQEGRHSGRGGGGGGTVLKDEAGERRTLQIV